MSSVDGVAAQIGTRWLLLFHQLPAKPAYFRVKIWRRLQALGAVAIKNAIYALPASEQSLEDFAWLRREISDGGGEAVLCEARLVDGLTDAEIRDSFNAARDADFVAIAAEARALAQRAGGDAERGDLRARLARLTSRHAQFVAIDFFGANARQTAEGLLMTAGAALEDRDGQALDSAAGSFPQQADLRGRVWVTRQGVHVDRIACAWLIRRFVDPTATFRFVPMRNYVPDRNELRFDMFEAEFTHQGDRCSFEVLVKQAGHGGDPALGAIAEIVHDIDLKDGKFSRAEAPGIAAMIAGVCASTDSDEERITRGTAVFDALYAQFGRRRVGRRALSGRRQ